MSTVEKILKQMRTEPANSSHAIYKTPWAGNPRVNIQNNKGKAKAYQVRQVLLAIERLGAKP